LARSGTRPRSTSIPTIQGYMEGGAITGVAAANEILADLKRL
jgi:hypothetical protein